MALRFKCTCPHCRKYAEHDEATQAMLNIPHHESCPGHKANEGMINSVLYDSACWEDRLFMPPSK